MIASGEASGNLNDILKDLAHQAEKAPELFRKLKAQWLISCDYYNHDHRIIFNANNCGSSTDFNFHRQRKELPIATKS